MLNHVLLISADATLADRVSKALALPPLAARLTCLPPDTPPPARLDPQLILWDDRAASAPALLPAAFALALPGIPIIRLTRAHQPDLAEPQTGVVDSLAWDAGLGKLMYVVRQRLAAGCLRRLRRRQTFTPAPAPEPARLPEIYNLLSSLLGNAELALQQPNRLSEEARRRMENVVALSLQIRDSLCRPADTASPSPLPDRRAA